jgi:hypothetical protein
MIVRLTPAGIRWLRFGAMKVQGRRFVWFDAALLAPPTRRSTFAATAPSFSTIGIESDGGHQGS